MPIYEYICEDCQTHFEKIVLNKTQEIACPKCAGKRNAIQLSVFSAANGSSNGASTKSGGFSGGGGSCCGGGLGCYWVKSHSQGRFPAPTRGLRGKRQHTSSPALS